MPLKISNYGEWEGDREGYHPPACTCYRCNEAKRREPEIRSRPRTPIWKSSTPESAKMQEPEIRPRPVSGPVVAPARPSAPMPVAGRRTARRRPIRATGRIIGAALRYTIALHAAVIAGLVIYAVIQDGAEGIVPALYTAWDAYAGAWASAVQAVRG